MEEYSTLAYCMQKAMKARLCYFSMYASATHSSSSSPERWHTLDSLICKLDEKYGGIIHLTRWLDGWIAWIRRFRTSYSSSFLNYIFSTYVYHRQTHTRTNERTSDGKKSRAFRSMSFRCHFSSSFDEIHFTTCFCSFAPRTYKWISISTSCTRFYSFLQIEHQYECSV